MRKLTRKSLDELAKTLPVIEESFQMSYVGGGDGTFEYPFTETEFNDFLFKGHFPGGYVTFTGDSYPRFFEGSYAASGVTITGYGGGEIIDTSDLYQYKSEVGVSDVVTGLSTTVISALTNTMTGTASTVMAVALTAGQVDYNTDLQNTIDFLSSKGIDSVYIVKRDVTTTSPTTGTSFTQYEYIFIDTESGDIVTSFLSTY